jgi:ribulose-phosphate 3-epimerase
MRDIRQIPADRVTVSPSLLAADFGKLDAEIAGITSGGADLLHLDVMDGHLVPNISFGVPVLKSIRRNSDLLFDAHLMISNPQRYAKPFAEAGADHITFHVECADDIKATIDTIRKLGCTVGMSLRPGTPAKAIFPYLELIDLVLVMTVEPGFGGQSFRADQLPKAAEIYEMLRKIGSPALIEADGGVAEATAPGLAKAGVSVLVAGTSVFRHPAGAATAMAELRKAEGFLPSHA